MSILQSGAYSVQPYNPVSVTNATTPAATGAQFTLQFGGLSALNGKNYLGTWKLQIQNNGSNTGALNAWSLNPVTVTQTSPSSFEIGFPTQTISGTYSVVVGPDSVGNYIEDTALYRAFVVAAGTGYRVGDLLQVQGGVGTPAEFQVTTIGSGGTLTGVELVEPGAYTTDPISPAAIKDLTNAAGKNATLNLVFGNKVDTSLSAGVSLLTGAAVTGGTLLQASYPTGTIDTPLPAGTTVDSTINVPDSYLVQGVSVTLSIQHQNDPDLTATLIAPDGTTDLLFAGAGASGSSPHANFTNTLLEDSATTPIQLASTIPTIGIGAGPYDPEQPLTTAFQGHGSLGGWILQIHSNSSTLIGTLVNWTLTLNNRVAGVGALVASQFTAPFRIFTQDPTNAVAQQSWTAVGPAAINEGADAGRVGGLAIDPSDPSGNTVYASGASGGVWKTTDFMTADPNGPTWIPLTNLGPADSLNTGSIAVFGRNNDPNQSIIFVATGEGSTTTPGIGFLRSMDGGRTWQVLDSTDNVDTSGNLLPINSALRDHEFVGTTAFRVIVDPVAEPNGQMIVYAALGGNGANAGIWRSLDSGGHWQQILRRQRQRCRAGRRQRRRQRQLANPLRRHRGQGRLCDDPCHDGAEHDAAGREFRQRYPPRCGRRDTDHHSDRQRQRQSAARGHRPHRPGHAGRHRQSARRHPVRGVVLCGRRHGRRRLRRAVHD